MEDQFASVPALVKDTVVRLFSNAGRVTEFIPDRKVMAVIHTVGKRPITEALQGSAFQCSVGRTVYKHLSQPEVAIEVATRIIDLPIFTVLVAKNC